MVHSINHHLRVHIFTYKLIVVLNLLAHPYPDSRFNEQTVQSVLVKRKPCFLLLMAYDCLLDCHFINSFG